MATLFPEAQTFACLMADPPWLERGAGKSKRGADRHYPLLATKELGKPGGRVSAQSLRANPARASRRCPVCDGPTARAGRNCSGCRGMHSRPDAAVDGHSRYADDVGAQLFVDAFPGGAALESIAEAMDLSVERVRQIEADALRSLERRMQVAGITREDVRGALGAPTDEEMIYGAAEMARGQR